ncbi:hypothetical protein VPH35_135458 [Triticum aestivum]
MESFTDLLVQLLFLTTLFPTLALCYINPATTSIHQNATKSSSYREDAHRQWHESFLSSSLAGDSIESRLLYSYTELFNGFAVRLTDAELDMVSKKPGFVRAFPDQTLQLMTTHTPEFLGLRNGTGFWSQADYGKGVIIELLDNDIYAAHASFNDHGVPPPPARWKGSCDAAQCNNKLISAKSLIAGDDSGDEEGLGRHTSSTAVGNFVTAGIAPSAHIAMYKVCVARDCKSSALLAGPEEAIKDGVDVLSLSLGSSTRARFDQDPISIGAFSAVSNGILVVCAAGNSGPTQRSVTNEAPWLLTVAAGSVDRSFSANIHLGNGKSIDREALTQIANPSSKFHSLLYSDEWRYCNYDYDSSITGKILICKDNKSRAQKSKIGNIVGAGSSILDEQRRKAGVYDTGASHVNPARAGDPGLVYDLSVIDYAGYICRLLGDSGLATIVRNSSLTCPKLPKVQDVQLNYPTITVPLTSTQFTVKRTVTNVGPADSTFKAKVDVPRSLTVRVVWRRCRSLKPKRRRPSVCP